MRHLARVGVDDDHPREGKNARRGGCDDRAVPRARYGADSGGRSAILPARVRGRGAPAAAREVRGAGLAHTARRVGEWSEWQRPARARSETIVTALVPRSDFTLLSCNPALVYLDSAATAQKPRAVLDAMSDFYESEYANPHRGAYALSALATERYARARAAVARFFGVRDDACVIFTRGTTDSINAVAGAWGRANLRAGDEVIVTGAEHHANFVPWQQIALERGATFTICPL